MKGGLGGLFQIASKRSFGEINDLHVHKGKDPVVEIQYGGNKRQYNVLV
jgi:hypothetical protein